MPEHFGVGRRLDGVMLVFISSNEIAQGIKIGCFALIESATSEQNIHDPLGFLQMVIVLHRCQREIENQLQIGVFVLSLHSKLRLCAHVHFPRFCGFAVSGLPPACGLLGRVS